MKEESSRRSLDELRTMYSLYPHFRDLVTEGRDDAAWLSWYLSERGVGNFKAFAVDDRVAVSREEVLKVHREVNARGRVVALAESSRDWGLDQPTLTCVIDSDFDLLDDAGSGLDPLLATDFAAMEIYGLADRPLSKFLSISAKSSVDASSLKSALRPAWVCLYALRYVLHRHEDGATLVDRFADKFFDSAGEVVSDVGALLSAVKPTPSKDALARIVEMHAEYLRRVPDEPLVGIRGHDVAPLIVKFLGLKNSLARPEHVEALMRQSIEAVDLDGWPLFQHLRSRLGAQDEPRSFRGVNEF